jgi:hypothetical protein
MTTVTTMSQEWGVIVPGAQTHYGSGVLPSHGKLVYLTAVGTDNIYTKASDASTGGLTLKDMLEAGARHALIQGLSADVSIGFGEAAVADGSILVPAKSIYRIENIGKLAHALYLLSSGRVVVQLFM